MFLLYSLKVNILDKPTKNDEGNLTKRQRIIFQKIVFNKTLFVKKLFGCLFLK
jgi:hypothetical protein